MAALARFSSTLLKARNARTMSAATNVTRFVQYPFLEEGKDDILAFVKEWTPKIRAQPGVRLAEASICGTNIVGVHLTFSDLDSFKGYLGGDFQEEMKAGLIATGAIDTSRAVNEFNGIKHNDI